MAESIGGIVIELAANIAGFRSDLKEAVGAASETAEKIKKIFEVVGVGLSVKEFTDFIDHAVEFGDQLYKASQKAGISADALSQLAFAARGTGVDLDSMTLSLTRMEKVISEAGSQTGTAHDTFEALGLTFKKIKDLAPDRQFEVFAQQISQLTSPADRARAAVELFGKSGADLLPLFSQGAEGIRKAREEAGIFGQSLSIDQVEQLHHTQESIDHLKEAFSAMALAVATQASPALQDFFEKITAFVTQDPVLKLKEDIKNLQVIAQSEHHAGAPNVLQRILGIDSTDHTLLSKQLAVQGAQIIADAQGDLRSSMSDFLYAAAGKPPGYQPDIQELKVNPNLRIIESANQKFFDDLDASTQTSTEKLEADTAKLAAALDVLHSSFRGSDAISLSTVFLRENEKESQKATAAFLENNKTLIDESIAQSTDSIVQSYKVQSDQAKIAGDNAREHFQETAAIAQSAGRTIQDSFAQAFDNIGKGGLGGLVADFANAFRKILDQALALDLAKALGIGDAFSNQGGGSALGSIFSGIGALFGGGGSGLDDSNLFGGGATADLTGFATGGSLMVGGSGGTDSQLVQFKATPGERVTINTPGQGSAGLVFSPVYNIGSGVSRSDVISACQATQKTTLAQISRLIKGGAFA